jgi:hypothetical protein
MPVSDGQTSNVDATRGPELVDEIVTAPRRIGIGLLPHVQHTLRIGTVTPREHAASQP